MFISISFADKINEPGVDMYQLVYFLEDTTCTAKLHVPIEKYLYDNRGDASVIPSGLISVYKQWNQSIPKNLAIFYLKMIGHLPVAEQNKLLHVDRKWTDLHFPSLEYTSKYFKCMVNQMKVFKYTGIPTNAQPIP